MTIRPVVAPVILTFTLLTGLVLLALSVPAQGLEYTSGQTPTPTATNAPTLAPPTKVTQGRVDDNRALWSASGIVNYRYDLTIGCFCFFEHGDTTTIVVLDGKTTSITWRDGTTVRDSDLFASTMGGFSTIDAMFNTLESRLGTVYSLATTFDATDGHPIRIYIDGAAIVADDETSYTVSNFTVIDPSTLPQTGGPP